jgi:DNA primase
VGRVNFELVRQRALACYPTLVSRWLNEGAQRGIWWLGARNPTRNDRKAGSFVVNLQRGWWKDYATDDKGSDPISLLAYLEGLNQLEAAKLLAAELGLDDGPKPERQLRCEAARPLRDHLPDPTDDGPKRRQGARRIWKACEPAHGSPAAIYLRRRGITIPLPPSIRFAWLKHPGTGDRKHPCMVAAMQVEGSVTAVHRTYLTANGDKADVDPVKMTLGVTGGAAIRLSPVGPDLAVCEGLETGLSTLQLAPEWCVWCAGAANNIRTLAIPPGVRRIVICADGDHKFDRKTQSYRQVGLRQARAAAEAWTGLGIPTEIIVPGENEDMNDILRQDPAGCDRFRAIMRGLRSEDPEWDVLGWPDEPLPAADWPDEPLPAAARPDEPPPEAARPDAAAG